MSTIYIAGKNDIASFAVRYLIEELRVAPSRIKVILSRGDPGKHTWQKSLMFTANQLGVEVVPLESSYDDENALFLSLEFDRILKTKRFRTNRIYNIHFSKLPSYRGIGTSVFPILNGESSSAVTLHEVDDGIDTGAIVDQRVFEIREDWTARELYFAFMENASILFKDNISSLMSGRPKAIPQSMYNASYYGPSDIDYRKTEVNFRYCASQVIRRIRAFSFWEFQLPTYNSRKILNAKIGETRSIGKPGEEKVVDRYHSIVSTLDFDVEIWFSPYDDLWEWSKGFSDELPVWEDIPDIDRQTKEGWSAAIFAAYNVKTERLKQLIEHGAWINQHNSRGTSLLMYAMSGAIKSGDRSALLYVLSQKPDIFHQDVTKTDVVQYAIKEGREDLVELINKSVMKE